jgi:transcriptional regulator with XRE-family HTH domain
MITAEQTRMARAAMGWSINELAKRAAVGRMTVMRLESGTTVSEETAAKVQSALEAAGAAFGADGDRVLVSVPK